MQARTNKVPAAGCYCLPVARHKTKIPKLRLGSVCEDVLVLDEGNEPKIRLDDLGVLEITGRPCPRDGILNESPIRRERETELGPGRWWDEEAAKSEREFEGFNRIGRFIDLLIAAGGPEELHETVLIQLGADGMHQLSSRPLGDNEPRRNDTPRFWGSLGGWSIPDRGRAVQDRLEHHEAY
ncbi:hypothetical protein GEV33_004444 [Tenebrio molitor]|uniref:Uncharacterized protein n=1 Tax=Tenebrio molitor TaxID=7067 RepID=A0A8J6LFR2_TENMO|nr:hypothetical protein GEV33_004444 [Tenebrio molitor]